MDIRIAADEEALDKWIEAQEPIDISNATKVLKEVKQILDGFGVTFWLRQGACLGAIRDNGFIPWDDDIDLGSVIGLQGLTEKSLNQIIVAFRNNGFLAGIWHTDYYLWIPLIKLSIRTDWICFKIIDDCIFQYPGLPTPINLFTHLKEITFIGEKFYVPNPPEEYLRRKYGEDWIIPKQKGDYEEDVLSQMPRAPVPGGIRKLRRFFARHILWWRVSRIKVLDQEGKPVTGAEVIVGGLGRSKTNKQGYARLYIPQVYFYALIVRFENHEEVLYEEKLNPGETYVYRTDVRLTSGRYFALSLESHPRTTAATGFKDS